MNKTRRTTANLPEELLKEAIKVSGKGITDTLVLGLEMVKRTGAYTKAQALKGKLDIRIDLTESRERNRR